MDAFSIIQNFFTRMRCNSCSHHLEPEGIQLLRHEKDTYVVNISCVHCSNQMGVALVGLEGAEGAELASQSKKQRTEIELTTSDRERLSPYKPINYDDVLDAHQFFNNLDSDWRKFLPEEMRQWEIEPELESEAS